MTNIKGGKTQPKSGVAETRYKPKNKSTGRDKIHVRLPNDSTVQALSQHLHMPAVIFFRPIRMIRTATVITAAFTLITSNAPNRTATPIRTINTPGILWQKQQHFVFSQHF